MKTIIKNTNSKLYNRGSKKYIADLLSNKDKNIIFTKNDLNNIIYKYDKKEIKLYKLSNGKEPVKEQLLDLDNSLRVKVIRRIERIYDDNFGDYKQLDTNLYELRFTLGKGYRIYYTIQNNILVLLLNAGDKSKQSKDIELAKAYLKDIKENKNDKF